MRLKPGFTLVELLVVVTIIALLLALLMPALDRAVYQAELARCATNLHGIGSGVTQYAMGNRRTYPLREGVRAPGVLCRQPMIRKTPTPTSAAVFDDRDYLRGYLQINGLLLCPLSGQIDLEAPSDSVLYANYALWYGWSYKGETANSYRLGGRVGYQGREFDLLASDVDAVYGDQGTTFGSHPDRDKSLLHFNRVQDGPAGPGGVQGTHTFSNWGHTGSTDRGPFDLNIASGDTSVQRFNGILFGDDRVVNLPQFDNPAQNPTWEIFVPVRR